MNAAQRIWQMLTEHDKPTEEDRKLQRQRFDEELQGRADAYVRMERTSYDERLRDGFGLMERSR